MTNAPKPRWSDFDPAERELLGRHGQTLDTNSCPPPDLLRAARSDAVPENLRLAVERHLEGCRVCQMLSSDLASLGDEIRPQERKRVDARVYGEAREGARPLGRWWIWALVPAAAAAIVLLLIWTHLPGRNMAPSPTSAPPLAANVFALVPARIDVPVPLVMRGASQNSKNYLGDLMAALAPYQAGNYAQAAQKLEGLAEKYPRSAEVPFYCGVSLLFEGRNAAAAEKLQRAGTLASGRLGAESRWYLAIAYIREGREAQAIPLLHDLCQEPGEYQSRACSGLGQLSGRGLQSTPR